MFGHIKGPSPAVVWERLWHRHAYGKTLFDMENV